MVVGSIQFLVVIELKASQGHEQKKAGVTEATLRGCLPYVIFSDLVEVREQIRQRPDPVELPENIAVARKPPSVFPLLHVILGN